jgi:Peptidase M15
MPTDLSSLSDHFSWEEASITQVRGVDNAVPEQIKPAVIYTANRLEYVRALLESPIIINSWYRSPGVNLRVGGTKSSQHMQGCAVDFMSPKFGKPVDVCRKIIKYTDLVNYDQLILEHGWVHISFIPIPGAVGRKQVLSLLQSGGYAIGLTDKLGNKL